jgi:hypothetical protein
MVGLEALSMQGLPVEKLLLTRESEDQLADLAGNAMSTTVVGACILAALVCGKKYLKAGNDKESYESKCGQVDDNETMDVDAPAIKPSSTSVVGEDGLEHQTVDLSSMKENNLKDILAQAKATSRLCGCEGRNDVTTREVSRCDDCAGTFCKKCGGRPEHNPTVCTEARVHPSEFARSIKSALPMCLKLTGINSAVLDSLHAQEGEGIQDSIWSRWKDAVQRTTQGELRFVELKRQEIWTVIFKSMTATLELVLDHLQPEWRLFALPEPTEAANAPIRQCLQYPAARLRCGTSLFDGAWEFAVPSVSKFTITVKGTGEAVPCWQARLGLQNPEHKDRTVASKVQISVSEADARKLDRDISGEYDLLEKCGTANGALHKKVPGTIDHSLPSLFMLFDPHRTNDAEDCFVFSTDIRRKEYGEYRFLVCKVDPTWRQIDFGEESKPECILPFKWVPRPTTGLEVSRLNFPYASPILIMDTGDQHSQRDIRDPWEGFSDLSVWRCLPECARTSDVYHPTR